MISMGGIGDGASDVGSGIGDMFGDHVRLTAGYVGLSSRQAHGALTLVQKSLPQSYASVSEQPLSIFTVARSSPRVGPRLMITTGC